MSNYDIKDALRTVRKRSKNDAIVENITNDITFTTSRTNSIRDTFYAYLLDAIIKEVQSIKSDMIFDLDDTSLTIGLKSAKYMFVMMGMSTKTDCILSVTFFDGRDRKQYDVSYSDTFYEIIDDIKLLFDNRLKDIQV
jgi:hypothetical protein